MLEYGTVIVTRGKYKGRIDYYDSENDTGKKGIVYWENMLLCLDGYTQIPIGNLSNDIPTLDLVKRIEQLRNQIGKLRATYSEEVDYFLCTQLLSELVISKKFLKSVFCTDEWTSLLYALCKSQEELNYADRYRRCRCTFSFGIQEIL